MGKNNQTKSNRFRNRLLAKISGGVFEFQNSKFQIPNSAMGFTVVELIVAIGLFSVIMSIAAGGLVRAFRTQRQVVAIMAANSNVSLVLEQITRELRTGYNFDVSISDPSCSGVANETMAFINAKSQNIIYCRKTDGRGVVIKKVNAGDFQEITADNVDIKYLKFYPLGEALGDGRVARVTIAVGASPTSLEPSAQGVQTDLQTTVSARQVDS